MPELTTAPTETAIDVTDILYFNDVSETPDALNQITAANFFGTNLSDLRALTDPGADRLLFWDDTAGAILWLTLGTNLSITGTTLDAAGGGGLGGSTGATDNAILRADGTGGSTVQSSGLTINDSGQIVGDSANPVLQLSDAGGSVLSYGGATNNAFFAGTNNVKLYAQAGHIMYDGFALTPDNDNSRDLGSTTKRWNDIFTGGFIEGAEMTAPAAPAGNGFRLFAQDNGSGKTQLMVLFATGTAIQLAIEV